MRNVLTAIVGIFVAASTAAAQDYKPVDVYFGFGWAFPTTDFAKSFDAGWNGTIGATFNVNQKIGIQGEYMYTHMNGPERTIGLSATPLGPVGSSGILQSNHQMHVGTFDVLYKMHSPERLVNGYVLGGGGIYHRIIQLTSPAVGYTTICDPYWYVCYPAAVSVDNILGDRSSNDFGIDFGGGVTFGHDVKFFVESRYHYVWGPEVTNAVATPVSGSTQTSCSSGCTTNAAYFPLTFGFRW